MDAPTARSELRILISDNINDKQAYRKEVFGDIDAANTVYKTLEDRRVTDFTTAVAPQGVYLDNTIVAPSDVIKDDVVTGEFVLRTAPAQPKKVRATYYSQWFLDVEIDQFIVSASQWCLSQDAITGIPDGLIPAVLHFAAGEAYLKLSLKWARRLSEEFRTEDAEDKERFGIVQAYQASAKAEKATAQNFRQNYYQRNDQARAPLYTSTAGNVRRVQPKS
jgi:hypothetical protein